jgi:hypothetical protein
MTRHCSFENLKEQIRKTLNFPKQVLADFNPMDFSNFGELQAATTKPYCLF